MNCPTCSVELSLMSTTNEWVYKCPECHERYNRSLEKMPDLEETLTDRILAHVAARPGLSAWTIAKNLQADSATVSSILHLKTKRGILRREKIFSDTWSYFKS